MDKCKWALIVEIFMSGMNALQRTLTLKEAMHNRVDKMSQPTD